MTCHMRPYGALNLRIVYVLRIHELLTLGVLMFNRTALVIHRTKKHVCFSDSSNLMIIIGPNKSDMNEIV